MKTKALPILAILGLLVQCASAPQPRPLSPSPYSIYEEGFVKINGDRQWLSVRGDDSRRPLLLVLHGGPGAAMPDSMLHAYFGGLLGDFVVVNWHQRGAGRSFRGGDSASLTLDQMTTDTIAISEYLLKRYGRRKLVLVGGSWGSFLGVTAVHKRPDLFYAFVGIGQVIHQGRAEELGYEFALEQARRHGDHEGYELLRRTGAPPYDGDDYIKKLQQQRWYLAKFGGAVRNERVRQELYCPFHGLSPWSILDTREFGLLDTIAWYRGQLVSERKLGPLFRRVNLRREVAQISVPVIVMQGRHDMQTPTPLVREWMQNLRAPHKRLLIFEHSAHLPAMEEPERFIRELRHHVIPLVGRESGTGS